MSRRCNNTASLGTRATTIRARTTVAPGNSTECGEVGSGNAPADRRTARATRASGRRAQTPAAVTERSEPERSEACHATHQPSAGRLETTERAEAGPTDAQH